MKFSKRQMKQVHKGIKSAKRIVKLFSRTEALKIAKRDEERILFILQIGSGAIDIGVKSPYVKDFSKAEEAAAFSAARSAALFTLTGEK